MSPTKLRVPRGTRPGQRARTPDGREWTVTGPAEPSSQGRPPTHEAWARQVHQRSGYRCQGPGCGLTRDEIVALGGQLQAAHIWPYGQCDDPLPQGVFGGPTLDANGHPVSARFDPRNGLSACTFKNRMHPKGIGNGYGCHAVIDRWGSKVPPGTTAEAAPTRSSLENLLGTPCSGWVTLRRLVAVWFAQGFLVFSFLVVPVWVLFAVAIGGIPSVRAMGWWLFSMPPATIAGIYLSRYAHRTYLPSRAFRALAARLWALALAAARGLQGAWRKIRSRPG